MLQEHLDYDKRIDPMLNLDQELDKKSTPRKYYPTHDRWNVKRYSYNRVILKIVADSRDGDLATDTDIGKMFFTTNTRMHQYRWRIIRTEEK